MRQVTGKNVQVSAFDIEAGPGDEDRILIEVRGRRDNEALHSEYYRADSPPHLVWDHMHHLAADWD